MFNAVWQEEEVVEEVGRKELLRYVGGGQGGEEVGRRVSTEPSRIVMLIILTDTAQVQP